MERTYIATQNFAIGKTKVHPGNRVKASAFTNERDEQVFLEAGFLKLEEGEALPPSKAKKAAKPKKKKSTK